MSAITKAPTPGALRAAYQILSTMSCGIDWERQVEAAEYIDRETSTSELLLALEAARPILIAALAFVDCKQQLSQLEAAIQKVR